MTQLLLDLARPPPPTFDNFVGGRNGEALAALRRLAVRPAPASDRCLYLWGDAASGRTHLLQAACSALGGHYLMGGATAASVRDAFEADAFAPDAPRMLAFDDLQTADPAAQEALFHAINALRGDPHGLLVIAGDAAPRELALAPGRDDLRSRLAWGLVYRLHRLDDDEKDAALAHRADERGFPLAPDVRRYLMTHFARDLGSLMRMVDALDRHALESQRVVTVAMVRGLLQHRIDFTAPVTAGRVA